MKSTMIKQRFRMNLLFEVFPLFVLLPNLMNTLIQNLCTWKLIMKTTAAYVYIIEQLRQCFYVLVTS